LLLCLEDDPLISDGSCELTQTCVREECLAQRQFLPACVLTIPVVADGLLPKRLVPAVANGVDIERADVDVSAIHSLLDARGSALVAAW